MKMHVPLVFMKKHRTKHSNMTDFFNFEKNHLDDFGPLEEVAEISLSFDDLIIDQRSTVLPVAIDTEFTDTHYISLQVT
jgi:hypothetical protein